MQAYSYPRRENDPYALPNIEVFWFSRHEKVGPTGEPITDEEGNTLETGWYYWFCFPGCMPDSEPVGPFATEEEALADAQEGSFDDDPE